MALHSYNPIYDRAARKKFVGKNLDVHATEALEGFVAVHNGLRIIAGTHNIIPESFNHLRGKIAVVAGGGSGHEPYAAGYVGKGMLAGASMGNVFTSPAFHDLLPLFHTLDAAGVAGILLVVINYSGTRLCFGIAMEKAKKMGIKNVKMYLTQDDCASISSLGGRRGLVGSVLLMKIAGALADKGATMEEITEVLDLASERIGSIGVCLIPGSRPGRPYMFQLDDDEFELGVGIHGEAGVSKIKMAPASRIIAFMVGQMTWGGNPTHIKIETGEHIVLLVNNLGGASKMEEYIICRELLRKLEKKMDVIVLRAYNGQLMTALDMKGIQFSVFKLGKDEGEIRWWLKLIDAPTEAPAWPSVLLSEENEDRIDPPDEPYRMGHLRPRPSQDESAFHAMVLNEESVQLFKLVIYSAVESIKVREFDLNELDTRSGDGDTGTSLREGVDGIIVNLDNNHIDLKHPALTLSILADICAASMGGICGALYSLMFIAASRSLKDYGNDMAIPEPPPGISPERQKMILAWISAFSAGVWKVRRYGGADAGDRTMLDALIPALTVMHKWDTYNGDLVKMLTDAAKAAEQGAQDTIYMKARAGRAAHMILEKLPEPDPGAMAVAIWMRAICNVIIDAEAISNAPIKPRTGSVENV